MNAKTRAIIGILITGFILVCSWFVWNLNTERYERIQKVYSVQEIVSILDNNPESLKYKDLSIKGKVYILDTVDPECNREYYSSYYLLGDYAHDYTDMLKAVFSIPEGYPTTLQPVYGIYTGHFYDKWQSENCVEGWRRFVVTSAEDLNKEVAGKLQECETDLDCKEKHNCSEIKADSVVCECARGFCNIAAN